ncbi:MAG: VWA domain-containing protein [Hyphomonadaceae bacterium]|nr:VWA domain-containing protein [Hyphomonadaceae bacterium]
MRAVLLGLLALLLAPSAFAQPTYLVVDTSTSMATKGTGRSEIAKALANKVLLDLPDGALVSTTYFSGPCAEPSVPMPEGKRAGQTLDEKELQTLKDGTPLGYALEAAFKAASKTGGKVVVFSDGGNSCAAVDPCDVMTRYLSAYKNIELQFEPIRPEPENGDKLACRWSARQPIQNASPLLATSWPTSWSAWIVSSGPRTNPQRGQAVLPEEKFPWLLVDLVLIVMGVLVAAVFVLGIATWRHHLIDEEKRKRNTAAKRAAAAIADQPDAAPVQAASTKGGDGSTQDRVNQKKNDFWKILKSPIVILILVLLASLWASSFFFPGSLEQGAGGLWWFAEGSFGSKFLPAMLLGFVGWALIKFWDLYLLRRDTLSEEYRAEKEVEKKALRDRQENERKTQRRKDLLELNQIQAMTAQDSERKSVAALRSDPETDPEREAKAKQLEDIAAHIRKAKERIEAVIREIPDNGRLERYARFRRGDYRYVVVSLEVQEVVTSALKSALDKLLADWIAYKIDRDKDRGTTILKFPLTDIKAHPNLKGGPQPLNPG